MTAAVKPSEYDQMTFGEIEAAVLETARGRWFLQEYARRIRQTETQAIVDALGRVERSLGIASAETLAQPKAAPSPGDMSAMDELLARLSSDLKATEATMARAMESDDDNALEHFDQLAPTERLRIFY